MKNCTLDINMNCISLENYNNMIQELVENETHILPFINEIGIDIMTSYWFWILLIVIMLIVLLAIITVIVLIIAKRKKQYKYTEITKT
jgi:NADH:ubiquinone oxidoreductase subunit 6 (subunit J)